MREIPTLFMLDEFLGWKVSSQPYNRFARQILAGDDRWVPRRKHNGIPMFYDQNGNWLQRVKVYRQDTEPEGFIETYRSKRTNSSGVSDFRFGWALADVQRKSMLRHALLVMPDLVRGESYELCGPGIHGNTEQLPSPRLYRHSTAEICHDLRGKPSTYIELRAYFKTKLVASRWEGIVWHGPKVIHGSGGNLMLKLRVDDFVTL